MATGGALFELEDQHWFPARLRRMQVEYIGWLVMAFSIYRPLAPLLARLLERTGALELVDLASGNGGPILSMMKDPRLQYVRATLTDRFPSPQPTDGSNISWQAEPLDALSSSAPTGFRTMFNAFHHFSEAEKQDLIRLHGRHGFLAAELLRPTMACALQILFVTTIGQLLLCPFVKPFRWERLFFTWIVPINLLTVAWDGMVSVVRVDTTVAMVARAKQVAPADTDVHAGVCGPWWARVSWFSVIPDRP